MYASKLIVLSQSGCRPCEMVKNFLKNQNVAYENIDVLQKPDVAVTYGIMSTPVTILLDNKGNEVQRSIGYNPSELNEMISKLQ